MLIQSILRHEDLVGKVITVPECPSQWAGHQNNPLYLTYPRTFTVRDTFKHNNNITVISTKEGYSHSMQRLWEVNAFIDDELDIWL